MDTQQATERINQLRDSMTAWAKQNFSAEIAAKINGKITELAGQYNQIIELTEQVEEMKKKEEDSHEVTMADIEEIFAARENPDSNKSHYVESRVLSEQTKKEADNHEITWDDINEIFSSREGSK